MAAQPPLCNSPLPMEPQEKKGADPRQPSNYTNLISALPLEEGWAPIHIRKYQGFWIPERVLPGIMDMQQNFKARPDDLFVMSHPKSGTTWLKALTYATMTRAQYPFDQHPLLRQNPHECVPFMDRTYSKHQASELDAMPSPRILHSHLTYSLLPHSIKSLDCKFIYVCRDPKDVLVSRWYFNNRMRLESKEEPFPFTKAFEMFCEGKCPSGPIWEHVLEYWEESQRRPEKVLFLKYEEMLEDPLRIVTRLAEFMGCPFSPEEEKEGVVEEVIKLCSFDKLKSLEVNKTGKLIPDFPLTNDSYFRKGEAGDWRNHMSPEMARKLDRITEQKLEGSGLTLSGVDVEAAVINGDVEAQV